MNKIIEKVLNLMITDLNNNSLDIKPFLKWAGGKKQLLPEIKKYVPANYSTYYEPFVGGGAVFFELKSKKAVINDISQELINVYKVVKNNVESLIKDLKKHKNNRDYFYKIRGLDRDKEYEKLPNIEKASRIIYLNKTCYNGLFRVNRQGYFNVPFGRYKNPNIVNEKVLRAVSDYLKNNEIKILNKDFAEVLDKIERDCFIYFDPPYNPLSESSSFTGYTFSGFSEEEQRRLKKLCDRLNKGDYRFLISNSATPFILNLYEDYKETTVIVKTNRSINCIASKRGEIEEVLIRNYEL